MSEVNLSDVNEYIRNLYDRVGLRDLDDAHSSRIQSWMVENMSNVGRYSHRDFERFGVVQTLAFGDKTRQKRQDGWQSLTEEVPDIDHITYGTGILYIHGEMEIPPWEDNSGNPIVGDEYGNSAGNTDHFEVDPVLQKGIFQENSGGDDPTVGYTWGFTEVFPVLPKGKYQWKEITNSVANPTWSGMGDERLADQPSVTATTPAVFNDGEIYNLDNERNHYPWVVINSGQIASVNTLLQSMVGKTGMYDEELPVLSADTYPPLRSGGLQIDRKAILDYLSPLNKTPE